MRNFKHSPLYKTLQVMNAQRGDSLVTQWKREVQKWAENHDKTLDAQAVKSMMTLWQERPFYSAAELSPILPAMALTLGITKTLQPATGAATLSTLLDFVKQPTLVGLDGSPFFIHPGSGQKAKFYIVERQCFWCKPISQKDFENAFSLH